MSRELSTRGGLTAAVLIALLAASSLARAASPENRAAAQKHQGQAQQLKKQGRLADACQHLAEAERLDPKLPTLIELAECSEQSGNLIDAEAQWTMARDRAKHDEKPQSRSRAETRLAAVQKRIAHLTLQLAPNAPAGAQVLRDDVPLETASLGGPLPMNPGDHVIVVKLAGHEDAKYPLKLADGDNQSLPITVGPVAGAQAARPAAAMEAAPAPSASLPLLSPLAATAAPPAGKQDAPAPTGWWSKERKFGAILGVVGVAGLGAGSALCVIGSHDADKKGSIVNQSLSLGAMSAAVGGVLFVSGIVLFASSPSEEAAQHARITVTPTLLVTHQVGVLGASGQF
jgi:hypothetical protein